MVLELNWCAGVLQTPTPPGFEAEYGTPTFLHSNEGIQTNKQSFEL